MSSESHRTNGFKVRGLNADTDRLAVQSTRQSTWFLSRGTLGRIAPKWYEIGLCQDELIVLRPYQGAPVIEIEGLGGPYGVLVLQRAGGGTMVLRNGRRTRVELRRDEALVIKTEQWKAPGTEGKAIGQV
jgi:hypothetical protein